jgi:predicted DCC family thiol-disulfide oxidoreductase YuxK
VIYDGDCGLCLALVDWAKDRDTANRFQFVSFQAAPNLAPELREACAKALHVVMRGGRTLRAGRAALFILHGVGHRRTARLLWRRPFVWAVELVYAAVAANRHVLTRALPERYRCELPSAEA